MKGTAKLVQGAAHPLLGRVFAQPNGSSYFGERFALEESEQDGDAIGFLKFRHGVVEEWLDLRPVRLGRIGGGIQRVHVRGNLFTGCTARFPPDCIDGRPVRHLVQPCTDDRVWFEPVDAFRQVEKRRLRDFFGNVLGAHFPECHREHQIDVPPDDLLESGFRALPRVSVQQIKVVLSHVVR